MCTVTERSGVVVHKRVQPTDWEEVGLTSWREAYSVPKLVQPFLARTFYFPGPDLNAGTLVHTYVMIHTSVMIHTYAPIHTYAMIHTLPDSHSRRIQYLEALKFCF